MRETLRPECVIHYLTASSLYGLHEMEQECREWLSINLVRNYNTALLKDMSVALLAELLRSPDLYVMQVEMDLYTLTKRWLFLSLHPEWSGEFEKLTSDADQYFQERGKDGSFFLETEVGQRYVEVFRAIRLQHILNEVVSTGTLEVDRIIPESWLLPLYRKQWLTMLMVDQRLDPGPSGLTHDQFNALSFRCGRVLLEEGQVSNFIIDLRLTVDCVLIQLNQAECP